ncbi:MAG: hypothetical protein H7Z40_20035 [Phycisphaerae bacterium]|nr:hypothetical protein [Gemmatimonadaceae bacterium]
MRSVRPVLIGLGTTFVFVMMLQAFGGILWPVPAGVDLSSKEAVLVAQAAAPMMAKLYAVLTFGIAVLVGAFLARKIAGGINTTPSWIVGGVYTVICTLYALGSQFPVWMQLTTIALPLPSAWLGLTLAAERRRIAPGAV